MLVSGQYRDPATLPSREQPAVSSIQCAPELDCTKQTGGGILAPIGSRPPVVNPARSLPKAALTTEIIRE